MADDHRQQHTHCTQHTDGFWGDCNTRNANMWHNELNRVNKYVCVWCLCTVWLYDCKFDIKYVFLHKHDLVISVKFFVQVTFKCTFKYPKNLSLHIRPIFQML